MIVQKLCKHIRTGLNETRQLCREPRTASGSQAGLRASKSLITALPKFCRGEETEEVSRAIGWPLGLLTLAHFSCRIRAPLSDSLRPL